MTNTHSLDLESGSSQYASITDASQTGLDLTGDFTLEAWVNFESTPSSGNLMTIISKSLNTGNQRGYEFHLFNDSGTLKYQVNIDQDGDGVTRDVVRWTNTPSTGTWYHLALTCDISAATATTFELFIDSASQGNGTAVTSGNCASIYNNTTAFIVGAYGTPSQYFDGKIDETRVWSDIRTSGEISANYQKELVGDEAGLVAYYKLNNDYTDSQTSGNNDLTASGSPVFSTDVPAWPSGGFIYMSV